MTLVCFTGRGYNGSAFIVRDRWYEMARRMGWSPTDSATFAQYLVASRTDTTKARNARMAGVTVIDYDQFLNRYRNFLISERAAPVIAEMNSTVTGRTLQRFPVEGTPHHVVQRPDNRWGIEGIEGHFPTRRRAEVTAITLHSEAQQRARATTNTRGTIMHHGVRITALNSGGYQVEGETGVWTGLESAKMRAESIARSRQAVQPVATNPVFGGRRAINLDED